MKKTKPSALEPIPATNAIEQPRIHRKTLGTFEDARQYLNVQKRALYQMIADRETNGLKAIIRRIGNGRGVWRFDMEKLSEWETPKAE